MTRVPISWILGPVCGSLLLGSGAHARRPEPTRSFAAGKAVAKMAAQLQIDAFVPTLPWRT